MKKTILLSAGALALVTATGAHAAKGKAKPAAKKAPAKAAKKAEKKEPLALSKTNLGALSLTGLIDTRIIFTDDAGAAPAGTVASGTKTRYIGNGTDNRVLFRSSQASLGAELKTAPKWTLKTQLNFDLEPANANQNQGAAGDTVTVYNAYMEGNGVLGENGSLLVGVIPAPIMNESGGPLGSTDLTITPGAIGTLINAAKVEGITAIWSGKGDEVNGKLSVGLFNNMDALGVGAAPAAQAPTNVWTFSDILGDARGMGDVDGDIGFWVSGFLGDDDNIVMGNVAYLNNGGDEKVAGAADSDLWTVGIEAHPGEGWTLKGQYLDGDSTTNNALGTARVNADWKAWYLLASYKGNDTRVTLRYDDFTNDTNAGTTVAAPNRGDEEDGTAWAVAIKHDIEGNQQIGLEYLWIDNDPTYNLGAAATRVADAEDNLLQLSYKWFF